VPHRAAHAALAVMLASSVVALVQPAAAAGCADVFPASYVAALDRTYPGLRITAAVFDTRTGCWHDLHRERRLTTASVVKAGVLGSVLLRAQDAGRTLTSSELTLAAPMIRLSHNPPTSSLYASIGGPAGLDRYETRLGATAETRYGSSFGATVTSARDRTLVSCTCCTAAGPCGPRLAGRPGS